MYGAQTEAFMAALLEWSESKLQVNDFSTIVILLSFHLGLREADKASPEKLKARILELVSEQGIAEDLLIMGLVENVTFYLSRTIARHGEHILLYQKFNEEHGDSSVAHKLTELTEPGYLMFAQQELDDWLEIVAREFSVSKRDSWDRDRFLERSGRMRDFNKGILPEVREAFADIPLGKLRRKIPLEDMPKLTVEQALEIKRQIESEE